MLAVLGNTVLRLVTESVLDSISVKVVGELCERLGLQMTDAPLDLRYLCRPVEPADEKSIIPRVSELLLAGSGFRVAGVRRFACAEQSRDYVWPGPVFRKLLAAWSDLVGVDIAKQFTDTTG